MTAAIAARVPEHIREALTLRLQGLSWRDVAERMDFKDHMKLYRDARSWDSALRGDERYEALKTNVIEGALEATARLNDAMLTSSETLTIPQLAVVTGIMVDKAVNLRRTDQNTPNKDGTNLVAQLLASMHGGSGKTSVTLSVETQPADPALTVDVTAIEL